MEDGNLAMRASNIKQDEEKFIFNLETVMSGRNIEVFLMKPYYYVKFDEVPEFAQGYSEFDEKEKKWKIVIKKELAKNVRVPMIEAEVYQNKDDNPFLVFWHELMHCLSGHHAFVNKGKNIADCWIRYFACEYWLSRAHIFANFYDSNCEGVVQMIEEIAPELKAIDFKDLTVRKAYDILLSKKRELTPIIIQLIEEVRGGGVKGKGKEGIVGVSGCAIKPSDGSVQKDVDEKIKELKQEAMLVDYFKNMGKDSKASSYLKMEVDEYIDWLLKLQGSIFNKGKYLKYLFDIPDYTTLFDRKIVYPIREPYSFEAIFIVDLSFSMSKEELERCFRYLSPRIHIKKVITHNAKLLEVYNSREEFLRALEEGKVKYGGGTDYEEAYEVARKYMSRHTVLVHITDGVCDKPGNFDMVSRHLIFLLSSREAEKWIFNSGCPIVYAD